MTPDTIIPRELDTQSWNRFAYCSNNPLIYKDPSGHNPLAIIVAAYVCKLAWDIITTPRATSDKDNIKIDKGIVEFFRKAYSQEGRNKRIENEFKNSGDVIKNNTENNK